MVYYKHRRRLYMNKTDKFKISTKKLKRDISIKHLKDVREEEEIKDALNLPSWVRIRKPSQRS